MAKQVGVRASRQIIGRSVPTQEAVDFRMHRYKAGGMSSRGHGFEREEKSGCIKNSGFAKDFRRRGDAFRDFKNLK